MTTKTNKKEIDRNAISRYWYNSNTKERVLIEA